jgi:uroporphyrinogen-III decarboxylase
LYFQALHFAVSHQMLFHATEKSGSGIMSISSLVNFEAATNNGQNPMPKVPVPLQGYMDSTSLLTDSFGRRVHRALIKCVEETKVTNGFKYVFQMQYF